MVAAGRRRARRVSHTPLWHKGVCMEAGHLRDVSRARRTWFFERGGTVAPPEKLGAISTQTAQLRQRKSHSANQAADMRRVGPMRAVLNAPARQASSASPIISNIALPGSGTAVGAPPWPTR